VDRILTKKGNFKSQKTDYLRGEEGIKQEKQQALRGAIPVGGKGGNSCFGKTRGIVGEKKEKGSYKP